MSQETKHRKMNEITRLTYLVAHHKIHLPTILAKNLPGGEWLKELGTNGPGGTSVNIQHIEKMMNIGGSLGEGSEEEAVALVKTMIHEELQNGASEKLTSDDVSRIYIALSSFGERGMYEEIVLDIDDIDVDTTYLNYFKTGFEPLDVASKLGFVNSLVLLLAKTGVGKTRLCLAIGEAMKQAGVVDSCFFIINEFNEAMLKETIKPQIRRGTWSRKDGDIFRPGSGWSAIDIFNYLKKNPQAKNSAVFFDNPDVLATSQGEGRRFFLDTEYKILAKCRNYCKIIFVTSQARLDAPRTTMSTAIEAKSKNYWSDVVFPINKLGNKLDATCEKNRFGPIGGLCEFDFDYADLRYGRVDSEDAIWEQWEA